MKKTIIGSVLLIAGVVQNIGIILSAALTMPYFTEWSTAYPSRLWFLIFAGKSKFNDGAEGLGLGILFVLSIILMSIGLTILICELVAEIKSN